MAQIIPKRMRGEVISSGYSAVGAPKIGRGSSNREDFLPQIRRVVRHFQQTVPDAILPEEALIGCAEDWLSRFYALTQSSTYPWTLPHITLSCEGEIVFEWWKDHKKLTIYVSETETAYLKSWGSDMFDEMEDGDASTSATCQELWSWLMG